MIKKNFRLSFIFSLLALLLFSSSTVFATQATPSINRLSGDNRYGTSAAVALSKWTESNYAILAFGEDFPDALSAAPLAKKYNAPILLTETNSIPTETLNAITQLKVKNVIIIGGEGVISSVVEQQLNTLGLTITRIFGQDRYETGIKIAEQLDNVTDIAIVTGESFADALSISPVAVKMNMPIVLVSHNGIPSVVTNYINSHKLTKTYVIGSGTSLNNAVLTGLNNIELITGNDKYQINLNIIDKFKSNFDLSTIYLATGENFADALSGSILAGLNSNPLVLVGKDPSIEKDYFTANAITISNINVLGGVGVIPQEVIDNLIWTVSPPSTLPAVNQLRFISTGLTKTGTNTATFQYQLLDEHDVDITKLIPTSQISTASNVASTIDLNPSTGIGTVTLSTPSDIDKYIVITLIDNLCGKTVVFSQGIPSADQPIPIIYLPVAKIDFPSTSLTKTGTNTATFQYEILDKTGVNITQTVPVSDIYTSAWVGSSVASITLNPITGIGTINYNFSATDKSIIIQLTYKNGVVGISTFALDIMNAPPATTPIPAKTDSVISKITISELATSIDALTTGKVFSKYSVEDQYGNDITNSTLAGNIVFKSGVGDVVGKNGDLTIINPRLDILLSKQDQPGSIVITAKDSISGYSTYATISVTL